MRRRCVMAVVGTALVVASCVVAGSAASAWDRSLPYIDGNGDGRDNVAVIRVGPGHVLEWYFADRPVVVFGQDGDIPVPGDYDGDGITDVAVYRPQPAEWFVKGSSRGVPDTWGLPDNGIPLIPVPADYDGDGRTDFAVYQPGLAGQPSVWTIWLPRAMRTEAFGDNAMHDVPAPADYDCDGRADIAVLRPDAQGNVTTIVHGTHPNAYHSFKFGRTSDTFVPGDWDGDGCADVMAVRNEGGNYRWYYALSEGYMGSTLFGSAALGDVPFGADVDGEGSLDLGAFRMTAHGQYFTSTGYAYGASAPFGDPGDRLVNAVFNKSFS